MQTQPTTQPKRRRTLWVILGASIAICLCLAVVAIIGNGAPSATPADQSTPAVAAATATRRAATPTPASRCQPAPAILLDSIAEGLTVTGGGGLRNGWTVRSDDYQKAYFVAAEITGEGMGGSVGVWVTNDPASPGSILSVNAFANEFSDWGDGRSTDAAFSLSSDGAQEAIVCAGG